MSDRILIIKSIRTLLVVVLMILISCNNTAQEEGIKHITSNTELPFKFEVVSFDYQKKDSSYVHFYIPQEFGLKNNYKHYTYVEDVYFSESGGNIVDAPIFNYKDLSLKTSLSKFRLEEKEEDNFIVYIRFKRIISTKEVERLESIFEKKFEKRVIYDNEFTSDIRSFLIHRIPNKGFIHFTLYSKEIKKRFFHNIPFDF